MARKGAVFFGLLAGTAVGWWLAEQHLARHRANLFSPRPLRRFAALGALGGAPTVEAVRLLRDYLDWERHPALQRRARALVRRMEAALG